MPRLRWTVIFLCFLANTINYVDRANLAVATPFIRKELGLDEAVMGVVLSGFFYTYSVMQLPAGWVVDRIGPRIAFAIAVVWWSVFTALTSVARSFATMIGCRLMLGVGEAGAYPSMAKVASLWFPVRERALASAIFDSGSRVGAVVALPLVTWIIAISNWQTSFVVTGVLGIVWAVFWVTMYRDPERHPGVWPERLRELQSARSASYDKSAHVPWASLFGYRTIWGMMLGFFCLNFVIYFFITWFPSYLVQARGFSLAKLGTLGMLPGLISIPGGWLGGYVSDWLYRRGWSLTAARKTCLVGGMLTSSVITGSAFVSSAYAALALFAIAYAALAFTAASIWSLPGDVAPTRAHVASIGGIQNFASNLAGIVTTTFTGVMLTITSGSFIVPLVAAGAACVIGASMYLFVVGRIEPLPVPEHQQEAQAA
ncbi:MAG: MFS transporter [Alphaproteobacteria bacterium]|nr:MFS transporter [Alphaproteobacteria bacterium]